MQLPSKKHQAGKAHEVSLTISIAKFYSFRMEILEELCREQSVVHPIKAGKVFPRKHMFVAFSSGEAQAWSNGMKRMQQKRVCEKTFSFDGCEQEHTGSSFFNTSK